MSLAIAPAVGTFQYKQLKARWSNRWPLQQEHKDKAKEVMLLLKTGCQDNLHSEARGRDNRRPTKG